MVIKIQASKWWEMLLNICPKNYSKLLLSCLGCPIEPIQGSSQLVREVFNWSKESFVIAKRGNVLPCVRALSLPLNLTLNLPASYPGNWLLLLHSLIPPHTHIVTVSLYLRLHPPDYSNNARLSRLLGLEFTSTCCACCGAGVRLGRLEELQGGAPSHRARIAGRTHTRCCAQLRVKLLPYSHWCTCLCTTQCSHVQCNSISCVQLTNDHIVEAVGPTVFSVVAHLQHKGIIKFQQKTDTLEPPVGFDTK